MLFLGAVTCNFTYCISNLMRVGRLRKFATGASRYLLKLISIFIRNSISECRHRLFVVVSRWILHYYLGLQDFDRDAPSLDIARLS